MVQYKTASRGRSRNAWHAFSAEYNTLRVALTGIVQAQKSRAAVARAAEVDAHFLKHFLNNKTIGHLPGLRLLRFAAQWTPSPSHEMANDFHAAQSVLQARLGRMEITDLDMDYFFLHLERLRIITRSKCWQICDHISGHFNAYRLSRNPGWVLCSSYIFLPYNVYNRLPHFTSLSQCGDTPFDRSSGKRTARGQIIPVGRAYILVGFVAPGFDPPESTDYDGTVVVVLPESQIKQGHPTIDGVFLSYGYDDRCEFGRIRLVRSNETPESTQAQIGEFSVEDLKNAAPELDVAALQDALQLDIAVIAAATAGNEGVSPAVMMTAALSFVLSGGN
jgi:hypothetical protein